MMAALSNVPSSKNRQGTVPLARTVLFVTIRQTYGEPKEQREARFMGMVFVAQVARA
jgi:hypothetical protein